jgi:hypothetical protein
MQAVKDISGEEVHKQYLLLTCVPMWLSAPAPKAPLLFCCFSLCVQLFTWQVLTSYLSQQMHHVYDTGANRPKMLPGVPLSMCLLLLLPPLLLPWPQLWLL